MKRWLAVALGGYLLLSVVGGISASVAFMHPLPTAVDRSVRIAGLVPEEVSVQGALATRLVGSYLRPERARDDVVLLLHGHGDSRRGMRGLAEFFLQHGFRVLMPDSRAHGESGGDAITFGRYESEDVSRWLDWLSAHDHPRCIYGLGKSMGAAILMSSLGREHRFCAVVAEAGFSSAREVGFDRVGQITHLGLFAAKTILRPIVEVSLAYARFVRGIDLGAFEPAREVEKRGTIPLFIVHGEADINIPIRHAYEIYQHSQSGPVELWTVPGAGHCQARATAPAEFERRVLAYFGATP
jgi:fermentation-respiration switch protein FrsA (DUF1100 family)